LLAFLLVDVLQPAADTKANNASKLTRGKGAYGVALDPATHTAYVANFVSNTVSVLSTG
jgi:DNA-binding beta-propeller fold protein YncE